MNDSYKQDLLDLRFASIKDHGAEKPQCVVYVAGLQEELIDLHHDEFHRQLFSTASLGEF